MTSSANLGGFKVLKDVVCFSLVSEEGNEYFPAELCQAVAREHINLPYITCLPQGRSWGLSIMVDAGDEAGVSRLIRRVFGSRVVRKTHSVILSIFPHKNNPWITGVLFEALGREGLEPEAMANSPAAISLVLEKDLLEKASSTLFGPFSFSAYRTPDDWKLAQRGRETLYREVVASYQERRPKVYGLKYRLNQRFFHMTADRGYIASFGSLLKEFARLGNTLTFLATSPHREAGRGNIVLCLTRSEDCDFGEMIHRISPGLKVESNSRVGLFSMTGPHFGDRYGIASELLNALRRSGVGLLGMNCSIASIKGVVPSDQIQVALSTIQGCFEVPSLIKKD